MVLAASALDILTFGLLGLILGSFASALIHRVPAGLSWFSFLNSAERRSACPHCGTTLAMMDLVPVLSWIFLKGRCRYCGEPIGIIYPLAELSVMMAAIAYVCVRGVYPLEISVPVLLACPFLVALFVIDLKTKTLPNPLVLILAVLGAVHLIGGALHAEHLSFVAFEYIGGAFFYGLIAFILALTMEKILKKPALGGGDIKFMTVCGLWLGLSNLAAFFIISGVLGVLLGLLWRKWQGQSVFPFGPALILAFYALLLV